jgi:hypothetical protein
MGTETMSAPVVLFTFNRPHFTRVVLTRILEAMPRKIYFVQDGPRAGNSLDQSSVSEVLALLEIIPNHIEVVQIIAEVNLGLRERFLTALDQVFEVEESAVIIEDDCLVEASFFEFANRCLSFYKDSSAVLSVNAHRPVGIPFSRKATFEEIPRVWGWATWADRWKSFRDADSPDLNDEAVRRDLVTGIQSKTWRLMARQLLNPEVMKTSWAVSVTTFALERGLLSVSPPHNSVENLGGTEGTHFQDWAFVELPRPRPVLPDTRLPFPVAKSLALVWYEDVVRALRWLRASVRRPVRAFLKLRTIRSGRQ